MARPARPDAERDAVRAAAAGSGSAFERAQRLARSVAAKVLSEVDQESHEEVIALLRELHPSPLTRLVTDAEIDTAALIRAERAKRAEARGGRRLRESEWAGEDRDILQAVTVTLTERYRRHLR